MAGTFQNVPAILTVQIVLIYQVNAELIEYFLHEEDTNITKERNQHDVQRFGLGNRQNISSKVGHVEDWSTVEDDVRAEGELKDEIAETSKNSTDKDSGDTLDNSSANYIHISLQQFKIQAHQDVYTSSTQISNDLDEDEYDANAVAQLREALGLDKLDRGSKRMEQHVEKKTDDESLEDELIKLENASKELQNGSIVLGEIWSENELKELQNSSVDFDDVWSRGELQNDSVLLAFDFAEHYDEQLLIARLKKSVERKLRGASNAMKNMWKKLSGQGNEWGLSREEAWDLYEGYYKCITDKQKEVKAMQKGRIKPVHAIMALQGETVSLKCTVCARPDKDKKSQEAVWQYLRRSDASMGTLKLGHRITTDVQGTLIIADIIHDDAGQYNCLDNHKEYAAIYQVDIRFKERRVLVKDENKLLNDTLMTDHNLHMLTAWSSWGDCDACNMEGSMQMEGTCIVQKLHAADPVLPKDFPMLQFYPDGLPCHSTALPVRIRRLHEVRLRHEETLIKTCLQPCDTTPPPIVVTDKDGKTIQVIPANERFYDIGEKLPETKSVERRVLYESEGKHLILQCSDLGRKAGLRWMRGRRRIDPMSIQRQTQGRVWVDSANRLHIGMLLMSDTAVYNCWERDRHVVAIKLLVIDAFNEQLKNYITYGGFAITMLATVIALYCLVFKGNKNAK